MAFKRDVQPEYKSEAEHVTIRKRKFTYFMCGSVCLLCLLLDVYFIMGIIDRLT